MYICIYIYIYIYLALLKYVSAKNYLRTFYKLLNFVSSDAISNNFIF